jgi:hypothetical protein
LVLLAGFAGAACVGEIGALPSRDDGYGGAHGLPGYGPATPSTPAEAAMQAANPTLFDQAAKYFPEKLSTAAPKRMSRLTRLQLDVTAKTLFPSLATTSVVSALPRDPLITNYEYAENLTFNAANFTPYTEWVRSIAANARANPAAILDCAAEQNSAACLSDRARTLANRAFRGVAPPETLDRFATFFTQSVNEVGLADATADLLDVIMTSPNYVFREEMRTDAAGALLPAARLQQLTYVLADSPPEAVGFSYSAPESYLGTPDVLARTADQVLATPAGRDKMLRFFSSWLEVREADEFTIDAQAFPEFTPEVARAAVEETRAFLARQLGQATPKLRDVTEAVQAVVSDPTAFLYGLPPGSGPAPVNLDPSQRFGLFTLPAVIASHSGPTTTRLVKRGVFFTRKVMCLPLGQPPPDVNRTIPDATNATERQKIEAMTAGNSRCMGCHAFINPFGFMQENYDPIGRWRMTDQGLPIDATLSVDFLDEGPFTASTPVEALKGFTRSIRFKQCFTRQLFRFYMGRDEQPGDDPVLRQMFFEFADKDSQDLFQLLRTLAGSPAFSLRSEAP